MENFTMATTVLLPDYGNATETNTSGDDYYYTDDEMYGPYDYYTENDYIPHKYKIEAAWEIPIRGYISFFIALITILTNSVMIFIFFRQKSFTQTTLVLTSLAISDVIICFTRLPEAVYFNILGNHSEYYVTYGWCWTNHVFYIIYQIFRITSNWITALLGFQRCVSVVAPFKYKSICSMKVTLITLAVVLVCAVLLNIYEMLAIEITELKTYTTIFYNVSLPSGCLRTFSASVAASAGGDEKKSMMIFYIFSGLLYRILPVIILTVTTIWLAYALKKKTRNFASRYSKVNKEKENQYKRITLVIFSIMVVFLIAEIQDGIAFIIYSIELSGEGKRSILSEGDDVKWDTISSTLSLIGYACNFWIFFLMSKQFRCALLDLFTLRLRKLKTRLSLDTLDNSTSMTNDKSSDKDSTAV